VVVEVVRLWMRRVDWLVGWCRSARAAWFGMRHGQSGLFFGDNNTAKSG
jgi:hypothetical protein